MTSFLKRLPSFRRSTSGAASASDADDPRNGVAPSNTKWTTQEMKDYVAGLEVEELRAVLVSLGEQHEQVRHALQKQARETPARPALPHASHSMNKKRRADTDLERASDGASEQSTAKGAPSAAATNHVEPNGNSEGTAAAPGAGAGEKAELSQEEGKDQIVIEGQSGLVVLPDSALNATSGSIDAAVQPQAVQDGTPEKSSGPAAVTRSISRSNSKRRSRQ